MKIKVLNVVPSATAECPNIPCFYVGNRGRYHKKRKCYSDPQLGLVARVWSYPLQCIICDKIGKRMYAPITWPIALGKYRALKSIIYDKS